MEHNRTSVILAGAAPDSGNHGVTALARSTIKGLLQRGPFDITCLDNRDGIRVDTAIADPLSIRLAGLRPGRNILKRSNLWHTRVSHSLGLPHPTLSLLRNCSAVLDVSGGDSFSDIYGLARFRQIVAVKKLAISMQRPLILLPQTIGPFESPSVARCARSILSKAALVYARDRQSYDRLISLMGSEFDPTRHKLGVDLAFGLSAKTHDAADLTGYVGLNVSGLLWNDPSAAQSMFGLSVDYRQLMISLCENIIARGYPIVLVPHVIAPNSVECDQHAATDLVAKLPVHLRSNVKVYTGLSCPSALKGAIQQTEWFLGARMHATIAALSSGSPVVNLAYSDKAAGVFEELSSGTEVVDLRTQTTAKALADCLNAFERRADQRKTLARALPLTHAAWKKQLNAIVATIEGAAGQKPLPGRLGCAA